MSLKLRRAGSSELLRLDQIAEHLNLRCRPDDEEFSEAAIRAVMRKIKPIIDRAKPQTGEQLIQALAEASRVRFESVWDDADVVRIQHQYAKRQKELAFVTFDEYFADPNVDALLYKLQNARPEDDSEYVAVLNLRKTQWREYWDKCHELTHRIAEPPQKTFLFRSHPVERHSPVEQFTDLVASKLAFYPPLFLPIVRTFSRKGELSIEVIEAIRQMYAPSASLQSVANAVVNVWPQPALLLVAEMRGRKQQGRSTDLDVALRVSVHATNEFANAAQIQFFPNMRVPDTSPIWPAFYEKREVTDEENLFDWTTSKGRRLTAMPVVTSAKRFGKAAYAVVSLLDAA